MLAFLVLILATIMLWQGWGTRHPGSFVTSGLFLLFGVEWVFGIFEELVLKLEADVVGFDGLEGVSDFFRPSLLIECA